MELPGVLARTSRFMLGLPVCDSHLHVPDATVDMIPACLQSLHVCLGTGLAQ